MRVYVPNTAPPTTPATHMARTPARREGGMEGLIIYMTVHMACTPARRGSGREVDCASTQHCMNEKLTLPVDL